MQYQNPYPNQYTMMPQSYTGPQQPPVSPSVNPYGISNIGQGNYILNSQMPLKIRPVASYDEAKAVPTDFTGSMLVLTDLSHGFIYTKVLDPNTGSSVFGVYQRVPEQSPISTPPIDTNNFVTIEDFNNLKRELDTIKHELGIDTGKGE